MRLKSQQVGAEKTLQNRFASGQDREYFSGRKRNVKKKADGRVAKLLPQHLREEHQMVIMDPNDIPGPVAFNDSGAENAICANVSVPALWVELQQRREVVKNRPQGLVSIAFVGILRHFAWQVNSDTVLRAFPVVEN